jgi:hypothetical protein
VRGGEGDVKEKRINVGMVTSDEFKRSLTESVGDVFTGMNRLEDDVALETLRIELKFAKNSDI